MLSASGTKTPPNYAEGKSATPDQPLASQLALSSHKLGYIPTYNRVLGSQFR